MIISNVCIIDIDINRTRESGTIYTITYKFDFTGKWEPEVALSGTGGLPVIGSLYSYPSYNSSSSSSYISSNCFCTSLNPSLPDSHSTFGLLKATYKENIWESGVTSPLDEPDKITWTVSEESREIFLDIDGQPILNSANTVFDTLPTVGIGTVGCSIVGYRNSYLLPPIRDWHVVNDDSLDLDGISVAPGAARIVGASANKVKINGVTCYEHRWELRFKNSWDLSLVNMGFFEKVLDSSSSSVLRRIVIDGREVDYPWPLDSTGKALPKNYVGSSSSSSSSSSLVNVYPYTYSNFDITEDFDFDYFGWSF